MSIDEAIAEIVREAERIFAAERFEGTPEQYAWLAAHLGLAAEDDLKWRFVIDPEADDKLDPERPDDEAMIDFLSDDESVERFLTTLLAKYRAANHRPSRTAPERPPRAAHSAAFVSVRDRLLALGDDGDRAALARLFGAIGAPERDPSPALIDVLHGIAGLGDEDVVKLARWCRTYVTRSGQVPKAASR